MLACEDSQERCINRSADEIKEHVRSRWSKAVISADSYEILRRDRRGVLQAPSSQRATLLARRVAACINSAVHALLIGGQCGHSGRRIKRSCVVPTQLQLPGLGRTGERKYERQQMHLVALERNCKCLVVMQRQGILLLGCICDHTPQSKKETTNRGR